MRVVHSLLARSRPFMLTLAQNRIKLFSKHYVLEIKFTISKELRFSKFSYAMIPTAKSVNLAPLSFF